MTPRERLRLDAAKVFLIALWLVCFYRAVTQSIVHDEALTWELYLAGPAGAMFTFFDANHHFLNTLMMRVSTGMFGLSEFSMRLPALCAAALFFIAVYRIARRMFSRWPWVLLAVATMTLNPIVLDFMVAARGYGMALALWMWAFAALLPMMESEPPARRNLLESAVALSLSVAANLTFLFPAAILAACAIALSRRDKDAQLPPAKARRKKATLPDASIWRWFVLPIAICAVLFLLAAPLDVARSGDFYAGSATLTGSLRSMVSMSLLYAPWLQQLPHTEIARDAIAFVVAPLLVAAGLIVGMRRRDMLLLIPAAVATGSAMLLAAGHLLTGMPWPEDRTGLYFPVMATLVLLAFARRSPALAWIPLIALVLVWAAQFNVHSFYVWKYDADTRDLARQIAANRSADAGERIRVAGSWQLEPALNFYRVRNGWTWMEPVVRAPITPGARFYALIAADRPSIATMSLKVVYVGPWSGSVLAVPSPLIGEYKRGAASADLDGLQRHLAP